MLEARDRVGGAADASAPFSEFPEVKASTYSYVVSVLPQGTIRDVELGCFLSRQLGQMV